MKIPKFSTYLSGGNIYLTILGFIFGLGVKNRFLKGSLLMPVDEAMDGMMITMIGSFRGYIRDISIYLNWGKVRRKML
ncbi:hypothetical protein DLD82_00335 [Methanospirillum stamsii]|uniref:Uncharacterized protein n=1 Tax=Methanospirillum stamsii TaxID=1277351 RepID=A0A2V2N8G4_9EURY|nr:hypothetical protein DLD82_00335 [Methanospirillum stamsii]